jgi:hypothetical protein
MVQQTLVLFILLLSGLAFGQDERYYRQILTGELPKMNQQIPFKFGATFNVVSPDYKFDLDGDGVEEIIATEKRDGVDWIIIANAQGYVVFRSRLDATGAGSTLYKIRYVNISNTVKALILFFDEGPTHSKKFESTARILVLSYVNNDLKKMALTSGPHIFHEKEAQREQYFRRDYQVNVYDIDGDGIREIAVQYNHIQRIMKYENGIWNRY